MNFKLINIKYLKNSQNAQKKTQQAFDEKQFNDHLPKNLKGKNYKKKRRSKIIKKLLWHKENYKIDLSLQMSNKADR